MAIGDHLAVLDRASDSILHVLDRVEGTLYSYGRKGAGPGEFQGPWSISQDPSRGGVWIFDAPLSRTTYVDFAQLLSDPSTVVPRILNLQASGPLTGPIWTSQGFLISPGFFDTQRMALLDSSGAQVGLVGPTPVGDPGIPVSILQRIHQGATAANPDHTRIAVASKYSPRIEVFDTAGEFLAAANIPFSWNLTAADLATLEFFVLRANTRAAYPQVAASHEAVFALFSGRTDEEFGERRNFGSFVHVFDWQGRFLGYIELDVDAIHIMVDAEGKTLYAVEWDPVPTIGAYDLGSGRVR